MKNMFKVVEGITFAIWFMCVACLTAVMGKYELTVIEYIFTGLLVFINTYALASPIFDWIKAHKRLKKSK